MTGDSPRLVKANRGDGVATLARGEESRMRGALGWRSLDGPSVAAPRVAWNHVQMRRARSACWSAGRPDPPPAERGARFQCQGGWSVNAQLSREEPEAARPQPARGAVFFLHEAHGARRAESGSGARRRPSAGPWAGPPSSKETACLPASAGPNTRLRCRGGGSRPTFREYHAKTPWRANPDGADAAGIGGQSGERAKDFSASALKAFWVGSSVGRAAAF
jgi:hypothetical protein